MLLNSYPGATELQIESRLHLIRKALREMQPRISGAEKLQKRPIFKVYQAGYTKKLNLYKNSTVQMKGSKIKY